MADHEHENLASAIYRTMVAACGESGEVWLGNKPDPCLFSVQNIVGNPVIRLRPYSGRNRIR